jgi:ABC-type phosphate/phosphonate transport system substrate-binding protein
MMVDISRRRALTVMLGAGPCLRRTMAAEPGALRIAISESMVPEVNLNDARAAMQMWIKRMQSDLSVAIEIDGKVFSSTEEITRGIRSGQLDAAALNVVEYRPIADLFDRSEILVGSGVSGPDEYLLLVNRDGGYRRLADLRGCRLCMSANPKMCVAPAWLATLLEREQLGPPEAFFSHTASDTRVSRTILPVFFKQAEACVTSRRAFETMGELNPQVARSLEAVETSATLVTCFYAFRRNFHSPEREKLLRLHNGLLSNAAGRQLAALFQFDELMVRDASCLAGSLSILEKIERIQTRVAPGVHKG